MIEYYEYYVIIFDDDILRPLYSYHFHDRLAAEALFNELCSSDSDLHYILCKSLSANF